MNLSELEKVLRTAIQGVERKQLALVSLGGNEAVTRQLPTEFADAARTLTERGRVPSKSKSILRYATQGWI